MLRDNLRYLIIALAIAIYALAYAISHRYQVTIDKSRSPSRYLVLDRWTGHVQTHY